MDKAWSAELYACHSMMHVQQYFAHALLPTEMQPTKVRRITCPIYMLNNYKAFKLGLDCQHVASGAVAPQALANNVHVLACMTSNKYDPMQA